MKYVLHGVYIKIRDLGGILNNLHGILCIASWDILQYWEGSLSYRNSFSFWFFPLGKPVPDKLRKQFSIYVPLNRKPSITPLPWEIGPINLAIRPHVSLFLPLVLYSWCLLAWICLVDPTTHQDRRISSRSRGFVLMPCTLEQILIALGEVFSSQGTLFSALVILIAMDDPQTSQKVVFLGRPGFLWRLSSTSTSTSCFVCR